MGKTASHSLHGNSPFSFMSLMRWSFSSLIISLGSLEVSCSIEVNWDNLEGVSAGGSCEGVMGFTGEDKSKTFSSFFLGKGCGTTSSLRGGGGC